MVSWKRVLKRTVIDILKVVAYCVAIHLTRQSNRRFSYACGLFLNCVVVISAATIGSYLERIKEKTKPRQPLSSSAKTAAEPATK